MSDAKGKAHVHCVIIGLTRRDDEPREKRLFSYDDIRGDPKESRHAALSPYLFDASGLTTRYTVVRDQRLPPANVAPLRMGSKLVDDGHFIFDDEQKQKFEKREPKSASLFVPLVGSEEFINGKKRWILRLEGVPPEKLRSMPLVTERIMAVRNYRAASRKANTRELADTPTRFEVTTIPTRPYLAIPKVSSERRDYVPIGWLEPPTLPSQLVHVMIDANPWNFALITSRMHMAWLRFIGGRLKSDYQYSIGIVYNPFPWPQLDDAAKAKLGILAQAVLDARAAHEGATLADLYDPDVMPPDLRKAHRNLDEAVDRLYRAAPFASDRERVEHLFGLYEKLTAPMLATTVKPKRGRTSRLRKP